MCNRTETFRGYGRSSCIVFSCDGVISSRNTSASFSGLGLIKKHESVRTTLMRTCFHKENIKLVSLYHMIPTKWVVVFSKLQSNLRHSSHMKGVFSLLQLLLLGVFLFVSVHFVGVMILLS